LLAHQSKAQLNLQVGYGLGFVNLSETEKLFAAYKSQNPWLSGDFQKINYLNGFTVGLRQSWSGFAVGLNWKYRFSDTKVDGINPAGNSAFTKELFFNAQSYSFTLETGGEWFRLGTSLDYNLLYIKERHTGSSDKSAVSKEYQWGSHFYININFPASASCQISLQPYYFMPWNSFDLMELKNDLQITGEPGSNHQSLSHFGISLILSNGPQWGN
jgi:hypothetical protein